MYPTTLALWAREWWTLLLLSLLGGRIGASVPVAVVISVGIKLVSSPTLASQSRKLIFGIHILAALATLPSCISRQGDRFEQGFARSIFAGTAAIAFLTPSHTMGSDRSIWVPGAKLLALICLGIAFWPRSFRLRGLGLIATATAVLVVLMELGADISSLLIILLGAITGFLGLSGRVRSDAGVGVAPMALVVVLCHFLSQGLAAFGECRFWGIASVTRCVAMLGHVE
jgi:hypothetical protein